MRARPFHTPQSASPAPAIASGTRSFAWIRRVLSGMPRLALFALVLLSASSCRTPGSATELRRRGDEIMVCGRLFHTGVPVVLWTDPGGYDAYRVERRFSPIGESDWDKTRASGAAVDSPNRFGLRRERLSADEIEQVRGGGWDLPLLQRVVDQFVIHYDACGTSRRCFEVLHDQRGLSVHFMLDVDGTLYQTLDLKERAWHATTSNSRGIGIEIAHPGAFSASQKASLDAWYPVDEHGPSLRLPEVAGSHGVRTPAFRAVPARPEPVTGRVQNKEWLQYDFTEAQYATLARLTATLCRLFPNLRCDYPRNPDGSLVQGQLEPATLREYQGLIGHFHIQAEKIDPGPAFDWDRVLRGARRLMHMKPSGPLVPPHHP